MDYYSSTTEEKEWSCSAEQKSRLICVHFACLHRKGLNFASNWDAANLAASQTAGGQRRGSICRVHFYNRRLSKQEPLIQHSPTKGLQPQAGSCGLQIEIHRRASSSHKIDLNQKFYCSPASLTPKISTAWDWFNVSTAANQKSMCSCTTSPFETNMLVRMYFIRNYWITWIFACMLLSQKSK